MIFLLLFYAQTSLQQVQYDLGQGQCGAEGWTENLQPSPSYPSQCLSSWQCSLNNEYLISYSTVVTKTLILAPHYKISIAGTLHGYYFDNSMSRMAYITWDNQRVTVISEVLAVRLSTCTTYIPYYITILQDFLHTTNSLTIILRVLYQWWSIESIQLTVYYCNHGCQFCEFSGSCLHYSRYLVLNLNPLSVISGWYRNGVISTIQYQILDVWSLSLTNNDAYMLEKQIPIAINGKFRLAFKAVTRTMSVYRIQIFINQILVSEQYSSGDVAAISCGWRIFQIQQFQLSMVGTQNYITFGIKYYFVSRYSTCLSSQDTYTYLGIRDFEIFYNQNECPDNNLVPFDGCHTELYSCIEGCKECLRGVCQECSEGFYFTLSTNLCIPICGDSTIQLNEECDDGNLYPYDGCYNCKFSCPLNCLQCQFGKCISIKLINFDSITNFIELGFKQHQIINDQSHQYKILLNQIECYKSNYSIFAFQYQICFINQIQWCKNSFLNICYECVNGYEMKFNQQVCQSKCNDGYLEEFEQCDDKNNIQFDGCYKCQNSCQKECILCQRQKCLKCIEGWKLNSGSCYQACGDGIIDYGSQEECDDGNKIEFDGCYNCLYSCPQVCFECEKGQCLQRCEYGYYYTNESCQSQCGDQIVASNEECDDGNNIEFYGCYKCLNSCSDGCLICLNGRCQSCLEGYKYKNYYCNDICGNGRRDNIELCDDDNNASGDGCNSNCGLEQDFFCRTWLGSITECAQQPILKLTYISKNYEIQNVLISFTQQLRMISKNSTFIKQLIPSIIQLDNDQLQYQIEIIPIIELTQNDYTQGEYWIQIKFLQTVPLISLLQISFKEELLLINENDLWFDQTRNYSINLQPVYVLSDNQFQRSEQLQSFGTLLILTLSSLGFLMLIAGYFFEFFDILDILQYQAYFRYLNLEFPQNLYIYFQSSDWISLAPILEILQINKILSIAIGQEYLQSIYQFKLYEINADLITNIYVQIVQLGLAIIIIILVQFYKKRYFKKCFTGKHFYYLNIRKSFLIKNFALLIYKINHHVFRIENCISSEGIKQLFLVNSWDLTFKVLLFAVSNQKLGIREISSYLICSAYSAYTIFYLITSYKRKSWTSSSGNVKRDLLQTITLIKRVFFMLVLINLQATPLIQTLFQTCISVVYIGLLITAKLVKNNLEIKTILITEIPILLFTLSSISYCPDFIKHISEENRITLGFAQIGVLLFGLTAPLFKHINSIIQKSRQYFWKKCWSRESPRVAFPDHIFGVYVSSLMQPKKLKK